MKQQIVSTKLPTLEQAKEIANYIKRPINNQVVLIGAVAPKVSTSGVTVGEKFQTEAQEAINKKGLMVVHAPKSDTPIVEEGEVVWYSPNAMFTNTRIVTSGILHEGLDLKEGSETKPEMFKQFVVIVMGIFELTAVVQNTD